MGLDKDGYYSLREILGYNAEFSIVLSERGRGKSWAAKHFLINKVDEVFMCLYRQQPDLEDAVKDWVDPLIVSGALQPDQATWRGSLKSGSVELLIDGEIKGYFRVLTGVNHIKHEYFPDNLTWVWLDEFIPLQYKKLPGIKSEGDAIRTILKTIDHDSIRSRKDRGLKPLRMIMYANPFNWDNPILSYFGIDSALGVGVHRAGPGVVWELLDVLPDTRTDNKMTVDDFLGDDVHKSQGYMNQSHFVSPIPKGSVPLMSLRIDTRYFVIYKRRSQYWVKRTKAHSEIYSQYGGRILMHYGTLDGLQETEQCLNKSSYLDHLKQLCYRSKMHFADINSKFDFLNAIYSV